MNQRLQQFLAAENISQAQFADSINVARASVSHVLAGRNNPGYDFIRSLSLHYPNLNLEWLINGKGKMYKTAAAAAVAVEEPIKLRKDDSQDSVFSDDIFSQDDIFQSGGSFSLKPAAKAEPVAPVVEAPVAPVAQAPAPAAAPVQAAQPQPAPAPAQAPAAQQPRQRSITKIVIFYDDNTFQELK